jgi:uncharacterized protein (TIGR03437 family)
VQKGCAGSGCADIAIAKLDPLGQKLVYATYLGGSGMETLGGIAVDGSGSAYVVGSTDSADFPTTAGVLEPQSKVNFEESLYTGFVVKLSADGTSFVYATYLGGSVSDQAMAVAVDAQGDAYVGGTTTSPDLVLRYAIQSTPVNTVCNSYSASGSYPVNQFGCASGGFLSVVNPAGTGVVWATYLGSGSVNALALDGSGDIYATGIQIGVNGSTTSGTVGVLKIAPGTSALDVPANSIVNAASFAPGLPLPGGLASLFVRGLNLAGAMTANGSPLPTELAGVSILVGGVAAPILAIAPVASGMQQINFQVPFAAASNVVEIQYQGTSVVAIPQTGAPGVFILGDGTAAIEHAADFSLVTAGNPAHPGETIVVYMTGLGKVAPAVASGVAASGPATVTTTCNSYVVAAQSTAPYSIGPVLYAGLTPGFVGLYQANIQLRGDLPAGNAQFSIEVNMCGLFPPAGSLQSGVINLPVQQAGSSDRR